MLLRGRNYQMFRRLLRSSLSRTGGGGNWSTLARPLACHYSWKSEHHAGIIEKLSQWKGGSVDLEKDEDTGIATILINHSDKKNAMSGKMMLDLDGCVKELEDWRTGRGVVLAGVGGTFCSGGDLQTVQHTFTDNGGSDMSEFMHQVTMRLFDLPLISVAAINGHAIGGGAELATACDFRIMSSSAKVGFVQVKLKVATGWGGCTRLVKLLGRTRALQILASGMLMDSELALKMGFVQEVVPEEGCVVDHGKSWLQGVCRGDSVTSGVIKNMVIAGTDFDMSEALDIERQLFCQVWGSKAHLEAMDKNMKHD